MGTIAVGQVINQFKRKILDESNDDLTDAENVGIFNNVIRTMINLVPKIHSETKAVKLAPGILQFLPAGGIELVDIPINMGEESNTPGPPLRRTTLKIFNDLYAQWPTDPPAAVVEHFMEDDNEDRRFYTYPPVTSEKDVYVLIQMSTLPAPVVYDANGDWQLLSIPVEDQYIDAIFNGMLYQFYDDDSDIPGNTPRSQVYYGRFLQGLQLEAQKPRQRQS